MFQRYLKNNLWDTILCTIISAILVQAACKGFYIPEELAANIAAIFLTALLFQIVFLLCSYSRRSIAISIIIFCMAVVFMVFVLRRNPDNAEELQYALIAFVISALVFLLSRSKTGVGALFLFGSIELAGAAFLQYSQNIAAFLIFLWAAVALFFYRVYCSQLLKLDSVRPALTSFFLTAAIISVLIISIGAGVHHFAIRPLEPPTRELKLTTRLMSLEVIQKIGVSAEIYLIDNERVSDKREESDRISSLKGDKEDDSVAPDSPDEDISAGQQEGGMAARIFGGGRDAESAFAISYQQKNYFIIYGAIGIVLIIICAICLKRLSRKMWYRKMLKKDRKQQINELYHFFLQKLQYIGFPSADTSTPKEYANRIKAQFIRFSGKDCDFGIISDAFSRSFYGDLQPEENEYQLYLRLYNEFYKNCRKQLGNVQYAFKFFTL